MAEYYHRDIRSLSRDDLLSLIERLEQGVSALNDLIHKPRLPYIDNVEFMTMMHISKRTSQSWRDEGKIAYSQVGNKIYYRIEDIEEMLVKYRIPTRNTG